MTNSWEATHIGSQTWIGRAPNGSTVVMAPADAGVAGSFTPGDLLKLALAGCVGMSSEGPAARRLGADFPATIVVAGTPHATEDRYEAFAETILLDTTALTQAERDGLVAAMTRAIQRICTIGLTLQGLVTIDTEFGDPTYDDHPPD